jgi:tRNA modification GTPase
MNDVVTDFSENLWNELSEITSYDRILKVVNKIDLKKPQKEIYDVGISAKTGEGMDLLFQALKRKAFGTNTFTEKSAVVSNLRHYNSLKKAKDNLVAALSSIDQKFSGEFISVDLRNAESALGEIIGVVTSEDILNNIFSKFCIGK